MREAILEVRTLEYDSAEGSHSGLVRPPAKRVGGVEPPRGFESRTLRHHILAENPPSLPGRELEHVLSLSKWVG